jgi:shikimate dehydrogenase
MDRYAVMGNPIAHSKSPFIHTLFAEQTGQRLVYDKLLVPLDGFEAAVADFQAGGGKGLNITVPFKQQAWAAVDALSERAERGGAVNTIHFEPDGRRFGDNTDGVGLIRDLRNNHGVAVSRRRVLVLGAGGAVRGLLPALLQEIPAEVVIANRTAAKAEELAQQFGGALPVQGCGFEALAGDGFDIIVNGTSAGLADKVPPLPDALARDAVCYDMVYSDKPTAFVRWAQARGAAQALDGLGMLVEQAAEAFFLWRGVSPDTAPVIATLRRPG